MSDVEWESIQQEKRKLEDEIRSEAPSFDLEKLLAWVDGGSSVSPAVEVCRNAAAERLDILPLVELRARQAAERAKQTPAVMAKTQAGDDFFVRVMGDAIKMLHLELREQCLIDISPEETRRRFIAAWESAWPPAGT